MKLAIKIGIGVVLSLVIIAAILIIIIVPMTNNFVNRCETAATPVTLSVERREEDIKISWNIPFLNRDCNVTYLLQYNIEGAPKFQVNVTDDNYLIQNIKLETCVTLQLQLWAISETGEITESSLARNFTDIPHGWFNPPQFTDVPEGLLVTWIKPIELTRCNVHYRFSMISELGSFTEETDTERVIVPYNIYCFRGRIDLNGMVENNNRATLIYFFSETMRRIEGISTKVSSEHPTELIITWNNHRREEMCSIIYEVEFYTDGLENQFLNVTTAEARFTFIPCVETLLVIRTFGLNRTTEGPRAIEDIFECE